ncbi:MAG: pyridoxamine 5'-phosphate oxidase family protein [Betaproteobacteria bacterium]
MSEFYPPRSRELQERFDTRRLADRLEQRLVGDVLSESDCAFIATRDMFFLASVDEHGQPACSYKGGDPGFVRATDARTLVFPNYDGNGMFLSMGNVLSTQKVGMLFIDFEAPKRLRVSGKAELSSEPALLREFPEAQFVVCVAVTHVFPNCPRYIHRYTRVEPSQFVPRAGCVTPIPNWKTNDWAKDVLPVGDPARER